jgi:hypothetical protein
MLCFIIDLINVEFVGGAKRRATASIHRNRKLLSKFIIFAVHIHFMYTSHMQKKFYENFII